MRLKENYGENKKNKSICILKSLYLCVFFALEVTYLYI